MSLRHVVWSIVVGFLVGLFARAIMPGADHMGFLATSLIGILGSLVGGFIGGLVSRPKEGAAFHPAGFFLSVVGALVILFVLRRVPCALTTALLEQSRHLELDAYHLEVLDAPH